MILIKSKSFELSSNVVYKWIKYLKHDVIRINRWDFNQNNILIKKHTNKEIHIEYNRTSLSSIDRFWYRRESTNYPTFIIPKKITNGHEINKHIINEIDFIKEVFYNSLINKDKNSLSKPWKGNLNKITTICSAESVGLSIPEFVITNEKIHLNDFFKRRKQIVVKPISNVVTVKANGESLFPYTKILLNDDLKNIPNFFFPSLFQEYIEKKLEIRTFFMDGQFFSMAMFTQQDSKTTIDFRNYNFKSPIRTVPFKLPEIVENKLIALFELLNLKSVSIDIILSKKNEYVFLEINPVGQFGMVSYPCNYYLEKKIANKLINE